MAQIVQNPPQAAPITGLETLMLQAANGFEIHGRSINDILHISVSSSLAEINAIMTRAATCNADGNFIEDIAISDEPLIASDEDNDSDPESRMQIDLPAPNPNSSTHLRPEQSMASLTCTPRELWHL
jgi:hypothetical protein